MSNFSSTYPSVSPSYQIDFSNGGRIPPNATFSRSDSPIDATKAAASAVHFWSNEKHLSSENLLTPSTPDSSWTRARLTPTYSQTGPYAGANATLHTEQAITNTAYIGSANYVTVANTSYTYSVWVKQNTGSRNYYQLRVGGLGSGVPFVTYHLSGAGSIDEFGGSYLDSYSITAGPTGWYKLTMTITPTSASSSTYFFLGVGAPSGGELPNITGDTGNSFLVFGAQVSSTGETVLNETSGQIHREYAPTLKSVATAGAARFEYDPTDGQSGAKGLLVESQVANLCPYSKNGFNASNTFSLASSEVVTTENAAVAPSGVLEATLVAENSATGQHNLNTGGLTASAAAHTFSAYVKDAGVGSIGMRLLGPSSSFGISLNLSTGAGSSLYDAPTSYGVEDVGNGWKRIYITATLTAASWSFMLYCQSNGSSSVSYAGDGYSGFLFYGAQVEANANPSSWVDTGTGGSTATRAADSMSVATADIPGFSEGVGTIVCETGGVASSTVGNQLAFGLNGPASSNQFSAGVNNGGVTDSTVRVYSQTPSGDQAFLNPGTATVGTGYKLACRYELDNIAASMNGGTVVSDTSGQVPVGIDTLWIGELEGNYHLNSNIKRIAVYNEALSDTNLQALTS